MSTGDLSAYEVTVEQEIAMILQGKPHILLLGAGASKAALPNGDKHGRAVPLLREVAEDLTLVDIFPDDLKGLAVRDFEAAYSKLFDQRSSDELGKIDTRIREYFSSFELPDEPNLYDVINLSLRDKDAIFTFNWDPFLVQSQRRLAKRGITTRLPKLFFLHGNVAVGFCTKDSTSGLVGRPCSRCHQPFSPSVLLFPVEHKDYQSDSFIAREWEAARQYFRDCFMLSVFGYSAPTTDQEAIDLLKKGWGDISERAMEQTEIINRPGADRDKLRQTWAPFIHTHHYDVIESFYDSFIAKHPRRTLEAYWNQYWEAKFISDNTVPQQFATFEEVAAWYKPLLDAETAQ
ncbi:MAG: hypothetical protein OJF49_001081 [Ktedonobacterales bacterium]|jgi:hypothetical protein|nr:MAG: hypothetical protein OJF49_001081 [Ktedonobacterales bacterium]